MDFQNVKGVLSQIMTKQTTKKAAKSHPYPNRKDCLYKPSLPEVIGPKETSPFQLVNSILYLLVIFSPVDKCT